MSSSALFSGSGGGAAPRNRRLPSSEKLRFALSLTTKSLRKPGDEAETISDATGEGESAAWFLLAPSLTVGFPPAPSLTVGFLPAPPLPIAALLPRSHRY